MRRLLKPLAYLVVAAQLLLAVPAMASARVAPAEGAKMPCAGMQMSADHHCPCCPDGVDSMKDCVAACLLGVAAAPTIAIVHLATSTPVRFIEPARLPDLSRDPPLKPPPIS